MQKVNVKSKVVLPFLLIVLFLFLSSRGFAINLFPLVDKAVFGGDIKILKTYTFVLSGKSPENSLKMITKDLRKGMKKNANLYLILSITTDPVGDLAVNRRMGIHYANWIGQALTSAGLPPGRIAITEPEEDKLYFEEPSVNFKNRQKCKMSLVEGSDLLNRFALVNRGPDTGDEITKITILSPTMRETEKGFHILKGLASPLIKVLAVTVNDSTKTISVFAGNFETPISLAPGENVISVTGRGLEKILAAASFNIIYYPPKPTIVIESPGDGENVDITRSPGIKVTGRIMSRKNVVSAFLIHNGFPRNLRVHKDGTFSQRAILLSEEDTFRIEVVNAEGFSGVSDEHRVKSYGISRQHMTVILNWETDGVDLDLVVKDMYGHVTYFDAPNRFISHRSIPEGRLEVDDKDGFGPEIFNISENRENSYDIYVKYYHGRKETTAYITVILFPDIVPKKIVKIFGPIKLSPGQDETFITRVMMPEGIFLQASHQAEVR